MKKIAKALLPSIIKRLLNKTIFHRVVQKEKLKRCKLLLQAVLLLNREKIARSVDCQVSGVVFSMDRAMQLHALLGSYREKVRNGPLLTVIYRVSSSKHEDAYNQVFLEFSDVLETVIKQESRESFPDLVLNVLKQLCANNVFFLVDDNLFIEDVDLAEFSLHASIYCVPTLRHGENLSRSYVLQKSQIRPDLLLMADICPEFSPTVELLAWCWNCGEMDWAYPLSVDGHILQRLEVIAMTEAIEFNSPNTFEGNLQVFKPVFEGRLGVCYKKSKLVNIPYNKVQSDFDNIHGEVHQDYMLEKWNEGYIIDRAAYYGLYNESAHQEMPLKLAKKETI